MHLFDPSNVDAAAADATPAFQSTRQKELMEQIASLEAKVEAKEKQLKEQAEARSKQAETAKKRLMHHINPELYHRTTQNLLARWSTEHDQKMGLMQTRALAAKEKALQMILERQTASAAENKK